MNTAILRTALLASALGLSVIGAAAHATCRQDVDQLAADNQVAPGGSPAPLSGSNGDQNLSDTLAGSGGVLAPPPTGSHDTVRPANPNPDNMQTAPAVPPQADGGKIVPNVGPEKPPVSGPANRSQLTELLNSARQSADRGDEEQCRRELGQALQLTKRPG